MKISTTSHFDKSFRKRILPHPQLRKKFKQKLKIFVKSPQNPQLKTHHLKGSKKGLSAFSVTGNIRVVFRKHQNRIYLVDIGTHNQVY